MHSIYLSILLFILREYIIMASKQIQETKRFIYKLFSKLLSTEVNLNVIKMQIFQISNSDLNACFHLLEKENKGYISKEDFQIYLHNNFVRVSKNQLKYIFKYFNKYSGQKIIKTQYLKILLPNYNCNFNEYRRKSQQPLGNLFLNLLLQIIDCYNDLILLKKSKIIDLENIFEYISANKQYFCVTDLISLFQEFNDDTLDCLKCSFIFKKSIKLSIDEFRQLFNLPYQAESCTKKLQRVNTEPQMSIKITQNKLLSPIIHREKAFRSQSQTNNFCVSQTQDNNQELVKIPINDEFSKQQSLPLNSIKFLNSGSQFYSGQQQINKKKKFLKKNWLGHEQLARMQNFIDQEIKQIETTLNQSYQIR